MNLEVSDKNLYLFLPGKISQLALIYAEEHHVSVVEALCKFYQSETYNQLTDETTKLWHYGPVALYDRFMNELEGE